MQEDKKKNFIVTDRNEIRERREWNKIADYLSITAIINPKTKAINNITV